MNAEILWDSVDCGFVTDFSWNCFQLSLASQEKFVKIGDFIFLSFLSSQSMTAAVKRQLNCYGYVWNRWKNTKFIFISVYFLRNVIKDYLNEILHSNGRGWCLGECGKTNYQQNLFSNFAGRPFSIPLRFYVLHVAIVRSYLKETYQYNLQQLFFNVNIKKILLCMFI